MPENETPSRKVVNLRLPADIVERLQAYATDTERSVNGAAVFALRSFLDQEAPTETPETTEPT